MTPERNKTMMLLFFIFLVLIVLGEGRLNSEFAESGQNGASEKQEYSESTEDGLYHQFLSSFYYENLSQYHGISLQSGIFGLASF